MYYLVWGDSRSPTFKNGQSKLVSLGGGAWENVFSVFPGTGSAGML